MKKNLLNEQISRIKGMMGLNEQTSLDEIGVGAFAATQQAGKTPVQTTVSPESKSIADKLRNSSGQEEFFDDIKLIKNANQFWEVDAAIRTVIADRPDYGFEKLVNGGGWGYETGKSILKVIEYLKSIGIESKGEYPFNKSIEIVSKPTAVKPKVQWVKNNGFPLKFGQMTEKYPNGIIGKFQVALNSGLNGDGYFGPTTEDKVKVKFPQYKREIGVTEAMYNTIVKNVAVSKDLKTTYDMNTQAGKDSYLQQQLKTTPSFNPAAKYSQVTAQQQANADALKSGQPLPK
jgi:hypothetical protein